MAYQKGYLEKIGCEGFQLIEECYGRSRGSARRHPPMPREEPHEGNRNRNYMYSPAPQTHTVFQEPVRTSTAYVVRHVDTPVPAGKQLYQVPHYARPVEPLINGGNGTVTWHVYKVTQAPAPHVITSDQAVKNYGGIVSKQYYW